MSKQSILQDYRTELASALAWKRAGQTTVEANVAGPALAATRKAVPIDEYIAHWEAGIKAMEAGADQSIYTY